MSQIFLKYLLVCQALLFLFTNGTKLILRSPHPCATCGEESQIFYEQGNSDYCTLCTVRYLSCNFNSIDPRAVLFYLTDIICDKRKLKNEMMCFSQEGEFSKIIKIIGQEQFLEKTSDLCRFDKEEIPIKIFQTLNDMLKKRNIHKSLLFKQKKCAFCSQMVFNKILRSDCICENKICFPCNRKYMKENIKCHVCNKSSLETEVNSKEKYTDTSRQERVLNFIKKLESTIRSFNKKMCKYFSITASKRKILSEEESERIQIDWTNILTPRHLVKDDWQKTQKWYSLDELDFALVIILAPIYISVKDFKIYHTMWVIANKFVFDLFVGLKGIYLSRKFTSVHKNTEIRIAQFKFEKFEKIIMLVLYIFLTFLFYGENGFDFFSPYVGLYAFLISPFCQIMTSFGIHLKEGKVLKNEYSNFL